MMGGRLIDFLFLMFEQHPVPQQISSYQFRLVGDMTLKQFFQLAAGAVIALIIYATSLPSLFKWPLVIFFVVAGAAFAFLPLQERPLEEWISAFFRAVYGPTLFRWKKDMNVQYYASPNGVTQTTAVINGQTVITDASVSKLDTKENTFLSNITDMFNLHPKAPTPVTPSVSVPAATPLPTPAPVAAPAVFQTQVLPQKIVGNPLVNYTTPTPQAGTLFVATPNTPLPQTQKTGFVAPTSNASATAPAAAPLPQTLPAQNNAAAGIQAKFSPDAAPPTPATIPNVIVGQVMDAQNKIVEGAILEVKDFQGRPVRALKTNKAGHFMIVTPLPNGDYQMSIEKEGLVFDPLNFEVHGALVEPMAVKAK